MDLYCWCSFMVPKQYFSWSTILHLVFLKNLVTFWNRNGTTKVHKLKYTSILVAASGPLNYTRAKNREPTYEEVGINHNKSVLCHCEKWFNASVYTYLDHITFQNWSESNAKECNDLANEIFQWGFSMHTLRMCVKRPTIYGLKKSGSNKPAKFDPN